MLEQQKQEEDGLVPAQHQWLAVKCVHLMLDHTKLPLSVREAVGTVAHQYGIEAAVIVADMVLHTFDAGRSWGVQETVAKQKGKEHV